MKISKEAKETMQECVTEFLLFVTSEASEMCANDSRRTINGEDILQSMRKLGFDQYMSTVQHYLEKYRAVCKTSGKVEVGEHNDPLRGSATIGQSMTPVDSIRKKQQLLQVQMK